jgi:thiosulfate/3-mercaptopyruvate sulfurtransferase
MNNYAHPEALVETNWLAEHLNNPSLRIVESNEDILLYDTGHIAGAVHIDWRRDLQDQVQRDYINPAQFAQLAGLNGIGKDTTVVFYGDKANWWAAYALWSFRLFGHENVKLLNGGRMKWIAEGRPLTREVPSYPNREYPNPAARDDSGIRAFKEDALAFSNESKALIDIRLPEEFSGEITHMPEYPQEGVLRGGHIPGAKNVPWKTAVNEDGTFKSADELRRIYTEGLGLNPSEEIITYCRIGERSSHTWFALTYLLGYAKVRNYDGSWTEWGNSVRVPIARP